MKHIVALSGGKDSTAMALRLAEVDPREYEYVITPTGNELPEMFEHWKRIAGMLGAPLTPIPTRSLGGLIREQKALPNHRMRWCTRKIKIEPFAKYCASVGEATAYVGLRADEPLRTGGIYTSFGSIEVRYPLREWGWGINDVFDYLHERGVEIPRRTDCAVCFFQRLGEWYALWRDYPEMYAEGEAWEAETGHTFRSPSRDSWPASMADMRKRFEAGDVPKTRGVDLGQCRVCSM